MSGALGREGHRGIEVQVLRRDRCLPAAVRSGRVDSCTALTLGYAPELRRTVPAAAPPRPLRPVLRASHGVGQLAARVSGYHVAFLAGAIMLAAGGVLMTFVLRKSHTREIERDLATGQVAPVPA